MTERSVLISEICITDLVNERRPRFYYFFFFFIPRDKSTAQAHFPLEVQQREEGPEGPEGKGRKRQAVRNKE
jgi:hypothetical protein